MIDVRGRQLWADEGWGRNVLPIPSRDWKVSLRTSREDDDDIIISPESITAPLAGGIIN